MEEDKTPDVFDNEDEKEEEFVPPVRQKEQPAEEKKFWYELRQLRKDFESMRRKDEFGEELDKQPPVYSDVEQVVEKRNAELLSKIEEKERIREVKDFLRDNPNFSKWASKIEKAALHPQMSNLEIGFIARGYAYEAAEKIGAEKSKKADDEASRSAIGGNPNKKSSDTDYQSMSDDEFEKEILKAKKSR